MGRLNRAFCSAATIAALALLACSSSENKPASLLSDGEFCAQSSECASKVCGGESSKCLSRCQEGAICSDGIRCYHSESADIWYCAGPCKAEGSLLDRGQPSGKSCIDGQPYTCDEEPQGAKTCGCACPPKSYCAAVPGGTECQPQVPPLSPCTPEEFDLPNYKCTTKWCRPPSPTAAPGTMGLCEVPPNAECTSANCSTCLDTVAGKRCLPQCGASQPNCPAGMECYSAGSGALCTTTCLSADQCPDGKKCVPTDSSVKICSW